jgi:hypothetical protein
MKLIRAAIAPLTLLASAMHALCGAAEPKAAGGAGGAAGTQESVLGAELAAKCRQVLADRIAYVRVANPVLILGEPDNANWYHMNHAGWQELDRRLYDCAAEVSRQLAARGTK